MTYLSITDLKVKSSRQLLAFWWHALQSLGQAKSAKDLIRAEARRINRVHHTLTL